MFSVIVLGTTLAILKDAIIVLMEGKFETPLFMHYVATKCHFKAKGKREVQFSSN